MKEEKIVCTANRVLSHKNVFCPPIPFYQNSTYFPPATVLQTYPQVAALYVTAGWKEGTALQNRENGNEYRDGFGPCVYHTDAGQQSWQPVRHKVARRWLMTKLCLGMTLVWR